MIKIIFILLLLVGVTWFGLRQLSDSTDEQASQPATPATPDNIEQTSVQPPEPVQEAPVNEAPDPDGPIMNDGAPPSEE